MAEPIVISIDAMGGDNAPETVIEGVKLASEKQENVFFLLFGDERQIAPLARAKGLPESAYKIYHTDEVIKADEKPSAAVRYGRNSSMWKAIYSVRTGESKAVVSAGNTGAFMAMSKICLGTIAGVDRPALAAMMPSPPMVHSWIWLKHPIFSNEGWYPACHPVFWLSGLIFTMLKGIHGPGAIIQRECAVPIRVST